MVAVFLKACGAFHQSSGSILWSRSRGDGKLMSLEMCDLMWVESV